MLDISENTPIAMLTVGDLKEMMREVISTSGGKINTNDCVNVPHRQVFGLHGIENLFGVSHKTAQLYKDTFLAPAVKQNGRKIVVDADLALELFNQRRSK